jgi:hypothetical protein
MAMDDLDADREQDVPDVRQTVITRRVKRASIPATPGA